ncbi:GAF domain-containing protein [Arenimonas sp.]|uniref:GAF domain-containing protein n=1 Tax=Arenimonas sp. TaxID=1872635 RepID=UPI0039E24C97
MTMTMDETVRQRTLDSYRLVDSLPEETYNDIVRLASLLCDTPIALVTLLDRDRQWFKAKIGLDDDGTRRDEAFCNHAIAEPDQLMEVPDATADPRFMQNPLVTGEMGIRFYAGVPLLGQGGAPFGTVCVIDRKERSLSGKQKTALAALARLTMFLFETGQRQREGERGEVLAAAEASAATAPAPAVPTGFAVVLFELVDWAGATKRIGERAVERALQRLEDELQARLRPGSGDSVNRVTGSPELIVVLHGDDVGEALAQLHACIPSFERETELQVLTAHAVSESPGEKTEFVYLRADAALSEEKDVYRAGLAAAG